MSSAEADWTLRELPFERRLAGLLERVRTETGLTWIGLVDHYEAPEGDLTPSWIAVAPQPAPDAIEPEAFHALYSGATDGVWPGPTAPHCYVHRLVFPPDTSGPLPLLLIASEQAPAQQDVERLLRVLAEGLSEWRRQQVAARIHAAVEQMPDPLEITDRNGRLTYANRAWTEAFGHDPVERYGDTVAQLFRKVDAPVHDAAFYQFTMSTIQHGDAWIGALACRTASGEVRFAEAHVGPFSATRFDGNIAVRRDLGHRADRDEALARAHAEFRRVLSALPDAATVLREGRIYFANAAFLQMVDRAEADVVGWPFEAFLHAGDRAAFSNRPPGQSIRVRIKRPDGSPRIADLAAPGSLSFEGQPALIVMSRDVTDERMAAETLARAERLSALGSLAAGLAHEINNPLAYLTLNLYDLRDSCGEQLDAPTQRTLLDAVDGAERIQRIVKELRAFSGQDRADDPVIVDVSTVVTSALNIAQNEIRHRATLSRHLDDNARVMAREGPLVQVMVSLLVNSAQAIPAGDTKAHEIAVGVTTTDSEVIIKVKDTGIGIPAEALSKVFTPFYTSKPRNEGSGLGLSIARRVVEEFDGQISLVSKPGEGTTATVTFPRVRGAPEPHPIVRPSIVLNATPAKLLIVDDEVKIIRALTRILGGYKIATAKTWNDALQALDADGPFDVVLCDLMMPGRSGPDFFEEAVLRYPKLSTRFVFMTGGAFADGVPKFLKTWRLPVVAKPFDPVQLNAIMQSVARGKYDTPEGAEE